MASNDDVTRVAVEDHDQFTGIERRRWSEDRAVEVDASSNRATTMSRSRQTHDSACLIATRGLQEAGIRDRDHFSVATVDMTRSLSPDKTMKLCGWVWTTEQSDATSSSMRMTGCGRPGWATSSV